MAACVRCGVESPDRARFCLGCGAPLSSTCASCGELNPAQARFCLACGAALAAEAPTAPPRELRKTVTVVFCDVTGSTTLGERLDPESLRRVMGRYFDEMGAALERHGGTVEKFIGDAVMAVFGIPSVHEDDALRAVRAAAEMRRARDRLNEELERTWGVRIEARIGVNTGEVVAGDSSAGERFATGDTVNVAARLEQAAAPGDILIGDETYRLVRDAVRVERVDPLALKGKAAPVPAYRLLDVDLWAAGYSRRLDSPLVGRATELAALRDAFDSLAGATHVTLIGAAGLGKSRLTNEFLSDVDAQVLRGRCLSYGDGVSFWPVMEIVLAAAEIDEADSMDVAREKIARLLPDDGDAPLVLERVAAAVGLGEEAGIAEETFWGLRKLLQALSAERPLVVVIDDCHWAAPGMLDLIEYVSGWSGAAPIMLVCLARPELLEMRPSWPTTIALNPLTDDESAQLLENLAPNFDEPLRRRIIDTAEGNPLYIEQLVALIRDDGADVQIPPTIHALVAARLDRLQPDERAAIERGAVEGKVFHRSAVQHLSPDAAQTGVPGHLLTLVRKELIGPDTALFAGDDAFRFRSIVVRDAAYEAMPKQARAELHERFASWLGSNLGERAAEFDEILAYHLEQAYRYLGELGPLDAHGRELAERAALLYARAANTALTRGDFAAARYLLVRATELYDTSDPRRLELLPELGIALREAGDFAAAEAALAEAIGGPDRRIAAYAEVERSFMRMSSSPEGEVKAALDIAERAIRLFDELKDDDGLARAWRLLALRHWVLGEAEETIAALERAVDHAERAGRRAIEIDCLGWLAWATRYGPTPADDGLRVCDEIGTRARGARSVEATILMARSAFVAMAGDFELARSLHRESRDIYAELGMTVVELASSMSAAQLELLAGDAPAAEQLLREPARRLEELGEKGYLSTIDCFLGDALLLQGNLDEAAALANDAAALAASEDILAQAQWRSLLARVLARRGQHDQAEGLVREAAAITSRTTLLEFRADVLVALAEVMTFAGRPDEASAALQEALELYERKGNVVAAAAVREQLSRVAV
jgi:class 3 adenylate cyclase/tetratricopeptide (TPR) repeat protein